MSKSIRLEQPTVADCKALIEQEGRDRTYVVSIDREIMTLTGSLMRGFLLPSDDIEWFVRF